jgi:nitrite reductase/ring-hydroxylating ferredoxin subunit
MSVTLCTLDELQPGQAIERPDPRELDGTTLILLRNGAQVHAYLNVCPHAGRPLNWAPGRFLYDHGQLVCAAHGASFRPEDGYCIGGPCKGESLRAVAIDIVGTSVCLRADTGETAC